MPGVPFFRGWNRVDFYAASLVATGQIYGNPDAALAMLDAISPGTHFVFPRSTLVPEALVSITPSYCFVAVQGTLGLPQWFANVLGSLQSPNPLLTGLTHPYFTTAALAIYSRIASTVLPALAGKPLVLIGHSLGGAICEILCQLFKPAAINGLSLFVLGCPRVGDPLFSSTISPFTLRCENEGDIVTGMPPRLWYGLLSFFPFDGPGPNQVYQHPGTSQLLFDDFTLTPGENDYSPAQIIQVGQAQGGGPHQTLEYARRLRGGINPSDLTPASSKFVSPQLLDPQLAFWLGSVAFPGVPTVPRSSTVRKFTLFYNLGSRAGVSESFYATGPATTWNGLISAYLNARLALADAYMSFQYARISNVPFNRKVSWRSASDFGNPVGTYGNQQDSEPEQALLLRLTMNDDSTGRIFLHGFPAAMFNGQRYTPTGPFTVKVNAFISLLSNGNYLFKGTVPHTFANRVLITAVNGFPPRGAVITTAQPIAVQPGDAITIGGVDQEAIVGLNGRKIVIGPGAGPNQTVIGGAVPVIGALVPVPVGYLYLDAPLFNSPAFGDVRALTTHKVGRPFDVRPGRHRNLIPLRR